MIDFVPWLLAVASAMLARHIYGSNPLRGVAIEAHATRPSLVSRSPSRWLGGRARRLMGKPTDKDSDHAVGRMLLWSASIAVLNPSLGLLFLVSFHAMSVLKRRRRAQVRERRIIKDMAVVIELFAVSLLNGHNVATATRQVSRWIHGDIADAFESCVDQVAQGRSLSDALERIPEQLGAPARPLIAALVAHERFGAPVGQSLARLAADSRADRRRLAEAAARRLPVSLLFPLVVCVLPAFLLLTVVPVVAETILSFEIFASP